MLDNVNVKYIYGYREPGLRVKLLSIISSWPLLKQVVHSLEPLVPSSIIISHLSMQSQCVPACHLLCTTTATQDSAAAEGLSFLFNIKYS